jgi:hypothetical protein
MSICAEIWITGISIDLGASGEIVANCARILNCEPERVV